MNKIIFFFSNVTSCDMTVFGLTIRTWTSESAQKALTFSPSSLHFVIPGLEGKIKIFKERTHFFSFFLVPMEDQQHSNSAAEDGLSSRLINCYVNVHHLFLMSFVNVILLCLYLCLRYYLCTSFLCYVYFMCIL